MPVAKSISGWVAPFVGAWIEISDVRYIVNTPTSLRSSERGLKYKYDGLPVWSEDVAPFVGAWIEISLISGR